MDSLRCVVYFYNRLKVICATSKHLERNKCWQVRCNYGNLNRPLIEPNNTRNKKDFLSTEKKSKVKNKKITTIFGKSLFLIKYRMRYAINMPPNTKDFAINLTKRWLLQGYYSNRMPNLLALIWTRLPITYWHHYTYIHIICVYMYNGVNKY